MSHTVKLFYENPEDSVPLSSLGSFATIFKGTLLGATLVIATGTHFWKMGSVFIQKVLLPLLQAAASLSPSL